MEVTELALSRRLLSWSGRKSWGKSRPPSRATENFASRKALTVLYALHSTAARDKYWQKTRKTIVSKAHAAWWVRRKVVVERGGVLCCIVVLVRKKENVREPEAKSRFMVVARSLVHCLLVRFGNSPRMECNQTNLCRVCAAEQA
jgi:hypothetical protein